VRSVAPRTGGPEITVAEEQLEYASLVVALHINPDGTGPVLVTRWRLSDAERALIASGTDLYVSCLTFGDPLQPLMVTVGSPDLPPLEVEDEPT
jgi:hypothetical protein